MCIRPLVGSMDVSKWGGYASIGVEHIDERTHIHIAFTRDPSQNKFKVFYDTHETFECFEAILGSN